MTSTHTCRHGTPSDFLSQNVAFGFKPACLRMKGVSCKVLLLSLLLLFVNKCVPERVESENSLDLIERDVDGGNVNHKDTTPAVNDRKLTQHKNDDGPDLNDQQRDGQSVRFEQINIDFSTLSLE